MKRHIFFPFSKASFIVFHPTSFKGLLAPIRILLKRERLAEDSNWNESQKNWWSQGLGPDAGRDYSWEDDHHHAQIPFSETVSGKVLHLRHCCSSRVWSPRSQNRFCSDKERIRKSFPQKGIEKKPRNCGPFPRTESWQSLDTVCHSVSRFLTDVHLCPATPRCLSFSGDSKYDVCLDATEDKHCLGVKHRLENTKDNQPTCTSSIYRL